MNSTPPEPRPLTREQLDIIKARVERGSDPDGLAHWLARISDRTADEAAVIKAAAEDIKRGDAAKWYAAADRAAAERADD